VASDHAQRLPTLLHLSYLELLEKKLTKRPAPSYSSDFFTLGRPDLGLGDSSGNREGWHSSSPQKKGNSKRREEAKASVPLERGGDISISIHS